MSSIFNLFRSSSASDFSLPYARKTADWNIVLWLLVPAWLLFWLWTNPPHGFDLAFEHQFYVNNAWPLHADGRIEFWLHFMPKVISGVLFACVLGALTYLHQCRRAAVILGDHEDAAHCNLILSRLYYAVGAALLCVGLLWWLKQSTGVSCPWSVTEFGGSAAVVDPGGEGARILAQLKADGMELKLILLTHAHFDHTGGVAELCAALPGVPVYLHPADAALVGGDVFPAVGAETTPYQDGDVVKLGKMDIEVLHTPGHTPGGVTLKVGDVLLTGDTLFQGSMGRTDFEGGSYAEIMASLGRLGRLSGDYHVLPGHMGASTLEQERKTNYYLREAMEG